MTEREKILSRMREALKTPTPPPGSHDAESATVPVATSRRPADWHGAFGETPNAAGGTPALPSARQWLPKVGDNFEEQLALFQKNAAELKADFQLFNSAEEMRQALVQLRDSLNWKKAACHSGELTDAICPPLDIPLLRTDKLYDVHELEACDAGISECDALVAQTGSVLVTSRSAGGRALSVLPPHHVVLARREQLIADLPAAFELLKHKYAANYPSMISFITGPSRTGDIERILVLGAHGPKKLTVLCF
jgi:L-lactate dehydrogenase complex protein LldG